MTEVVLIVLMLMLGLLAYMVRRMVRDAPDREEVARLRAQEDEVFRLRREAVERAAQIEKLQAEKAALSAALDNEKRAAAEKIALLEQAEARLTHAFENLANRIFEDKGRAMTEQNRDRLSDLLQPLKQQLEGFRVRMDEVHRDDTAQSARLLEQVRHLQSLSNKVSDEANHLARAIKGDAKSQGDWGELIVERIFEASGLERGREYDAQASLRDGNGMLKRPDFIVYLPGDKAVIVDSKVSLTAYERSSRAEEEPERASAMAEHVRSVRSHLAELRAKDYASLLGNRTLDFVLMCIPLEPAFQAAMQADRDLLYDLARTNVVVTGPATLMITLKLIAQIWRREHENRNAEIIADRAGRMYAQVALVVEAMEDARKRMGGVSEAFDLALRRLQSGRGNLVRRVEELRRLGANVSKTLPADLVDLALESDAETDAIEDTDERT